MKRKEHLIMAICIMLLISIVTAFYLYSPRPIIADTGATQIAKIQYNPDFNQEMDALVEITDYDEQGMLDCLSQYTEQRTFKSANTGYWIGDVELEVTINTKDGFKRIVLGNENYSYESYGRPKYKILEPDNLKSALLKMIHDGT